MAAAAARIRLVHPFPSFVNGLAVLGIALAAGGSPTDAGRLAVSMVLLQFSIGSTNDLVDAPRDHDRVPLKPIASGLVGRSTALVSASGRRRRAS